MKVSDFLTFDVWSGLQCRLFWVYSGSPPEWARQMIYPGWPPGSWLVRKGSLRLGNEGETAHAGQWIFPGSQPRGQKFPPDAEILSIRFAISWHSGHPLFNHPTSLVCESGSFPQLESSALELLDAVEKQLGNPRTDLRLTRESLETHFSVMQPFYKWCFQYIRVMLSLGLRPSVPVETDYRVDMAVAWLRDRPFTLPWSEPKLALWCGLSVSQLNRLFVRYHGMTPAAYYDARRHEAAKAFLEETDLDIKHIAFELGFSTPGNFSSWFKRKHGVNPTVCRHLAKKGIAQHPATPLGGML